MTALNNHIKTVPVPNNPSELYLDLLKRTLTRVITARKCERQTLQARHPLKRVALAVAHGILTPMKLELVGIIRPTMDDYLESGHEARNRCEDAETMIGIRQLDNMQACISDVLHDRVPGDLMEAGVWRGGVSIFMRGVLKTYGVMDRVVWLADSFAGLPEPDRIKESYGWRGGDMTVTIEEVRQNFARYGLLDEQVTFLKGFFSDTLPQAPISSLAILRIDADLYESTRDALTYLYPRLSLGGFAIFDDYQNLRDCRRAIDEYRELNGISTPIQVIDKRAVYWRKEN